MKLWSSWFGEDRKRRNRMFTVAELSVLIEGKHHLWRFKRSAGHKYTVESTHQKPLIAYEVIPQVIVEAQAYARCWADGQLTDKFLKQVINDMKEHRDVVLNPIP